MHVRLHCPKGSKHCVPQDAVPEDDGCDDLDWWLSPKARNDRKKGKKAYLSNVGAVPLLPEQCQELVR
jgi:penicillin-insensitive murein endopeptidase